MHSQQVNVPTYLKPCSEASLAVPGAEGGHVDAADVSLQLYRLLFRSTDPRGKVLHGQPAAHQLVHPMAFQPTQIFT